jgi:hypothetical protein
VSSELRERGPDLHVPPGARRQVEAEGSDARAERSPVGGVAVHHSGSGTITARSASTTTWPSTTSHTRSCLRRGRSPCCW